MSVGKYSASADAIIPLHGTAISFSNVILTQAATTVVATAAMGPTSQPGFAVCTMTAFATDADMATLKLSAISIVGGAASAAGLLFGPLARLPTPKYDTAFRIPISFNGDETFMSYATLSTSGAFSLYSSASSGGFASGTASAYPIALQYAT